MHDRRIDETVIVGRVVAGVGKAGVHAGAGEDFVFVFHGSIRTMQIGLSPADFSPAAPRGQPVMTKKAKSKALEICGKQLFWA